MVWLNAVWNRLASRSGSLGSKWNVQGVIISKIVWSYEPQIGTVLTAMRFEWPIHKCPFFVSLVNGYWGRRRLSSLYTRHFLYGDKVERMTRFASRPPWRINNMVISLSLVTLQSKRCYNTKEKRTGYRARALKSWKAIFGGHASRFIIVLIFLIACTLCENTVL